MGANRRRIERERDKKAPSAMLAGPRDTMLTGSSGWG